MNSDEPLAYGVLRQRKIQDDCDRYLEEIDYLGYTVVSSGLDAAALARLRQKIDQYYLEQSAGIAEPGAESDILRCPLSYDDAFLEVATLPPVLQIATRALGQSLVLLQQNAIINQPGSVQHQSRWHRDLPYQHFVASRKLAVNALLCVDDFTTETGGTLILQGSHRFEEFPSAQLVRRLEAVVEAKAGSVIMMDAMLYHRAGKNVSSMVRRAVNHLIGLPFLGQQIDIPRALGPRFAEHPFLGGYLGYRWNPASSVESWRDSHNRKT